MRFDILVMSCTSGAQSIKNYHARALQLFEMDHDIFSATFWFPLEEAPPGLPRHSSQQSRILHQRSSCQNSFLADLSLLRIPPAQIIEFLLSPNNITHVEFAVLFSFLRTQDRRIIMGGLSRGLLTSCAGLFP